MQMVSALPGPADEARGNHDVSCDSTVCAAEDCDPGRVPKAVDVYD